MRPLSKKGKQQAESLVSDLARFQISAIFSSPYVRCVQTVEPIAHARGLEVKQSGALAEGQGLQGLQQFFGDGKLHNAVLSTHGDIVWELVEDLVSRRAIKTDEGGFEKGSTWVVEVEGGVPTHAQFVPAP